MLKKIDPNKLKVKYVLGNWASLSNYPDMEDILYEAIRDYCSKSSNEIKFTNVALTKKYNIELKHATEVMQYMVERGLAKITHSTKSTISYQIIKNPYA